MVQSELPFQDLTKKVIAARFQMSLVVVQLIYDSDRTVLKAVKSHTFIVLVSIEECLVVTSSDGSADASRSHRSPS